MNAVAHFEPGTIVPGFVYATSCRNCREFFLAIDTISALTNIIAEILDEILVDA
jgi:hypothetical protein